MVELVMKKGEKIRYTENLITVKGQFKFEMDEEVGMLNVKLVEAEGI